jgi:hypothetical protein
MAAAARTASRLEELPLPSTVPDSHGRTLDALARQLADVTPAALCSRAAPTRAGLDAVKAEYERIRGQMIALQEELDWEVYRGYGLLDDAELAALTANLDSIPELKLGERAFEIVLARRVQSGEAETQWFTRHRSTPISEVPEEWPREYRDVVARRIDTIEHHKNIGLIERPEYKRVSPAAAIDDYLTAQLERYRLTEEDLSNWTAPPVRRGRPPRTRAANTGNREAEVR